MLVAGTKFVRPDAEHLPARSAERAAFICGRAFSALGLATTAFWGGSNTGGLSFPGWEDYLAGRLDDEGLCRAAEAEARRLAASIAARIGGRS